MMKLHFATVVLVILTQLLAIASSKATTGQVQKNAHSIFQQLLMQTMQQDFGACND
jgi:hypothetical protein